MKKSIYLLAVLAMFLFVRLSCEKDKTDNDYKVVVLDGTNFCYMFTTGQLGAYSDMPDNFENYGLISEHWCTDNPAVCGNWVSTGESSLDAVLSAPTSGYLGDGKDFVDCEEISLNDVAVFKFADGTYAKFLIVSDEYTHNETECTHKITCHIVYPAFE